MSIRRFAREAALQFLYQDDFIGSGTISGAELRERFEQFCEIYQVNKKGRAYALELIAGILAHQEELDAVIEKAAENWRVSRISATDRNILRIASYEMRECDDVPPQVAINEAVEIAKRFCGDESPKFINGVLDAVKTICEK